MKEEENPWTFIDGKTVYESPWIKVHHHNILNPAGNPGTYSIVEFNSLAIGVVPLDEAYNTWIVGQYRYPLNVYTWEIPEGGGHKTEDPVVSAKRELLEECGIIAEDYTFIQQLQLSNSATDEIAYLFVATGLSFTTSQPEENEQLQIRKIPFESLYQMVINGEVTDSLSVAAVLKIKLLMMEGKFNVKKN